METFLQMVAKDLYHSIGNDLSRTAIVFPNKRASLFFNEHLAAQSDCPLWSPAYVSINDLFERLSTLKNGDPIRLVCELYKVFREETQSAETLDDFYFWGELLISDFDDIDKNMVKAEGLFSNLKDLKDIMPTPDYLNEEQTEAIRQFFHNFSPEKRTELKNRFINLWDKLGDIYRSYKQRLAKLGIAYEGMLYRQVMEELDTSQLEYERYVFVGFNVLNEVERRFFQALQDAEKAWFYWDYDIFYTRLPENNTPPFRHEAGEFILSNLSLFPNRLPESCFDVMSRPKRVRYISAPTENAQARYLSTLLAEDNVKECDEKENAVVLCNESLLLPVLHTLPSNIKNVNITMGFPLAQTPVYSLINALMEMQTTGYRSDTGRYTYETVLPVLRHPYIRRLTPQAETLEHQLTKNNRFYPLPSELKTDAVLEKIFTPQNGIKELCAYLTERIKDMFKTSNGKYISPQLIETKLTLDKYIDQAVVVADRRKFVAALIVPVREQVERYAAAHDIAWGSIGELYADARIQKLFAARIETMQQDLAHYEKVKRFLLLTRPFSMETGELTNTLKVRRAVVYEHYAESIDRLYEEAEREQAARA